MKEPTYNEIIAKTEKVQTRYKRYRPLVSNVKKLHALILTILLLKTILKISVKIPCLLKHFMKTFKFSLIE